MIKRIVLLLATAIFVYSASAQTPAKLLSYYNKDYKVGFRYPANLDFDSKTATDDETGFTILATASVPDKSYRRTNFSEATATVEVGNVGESACHELPNDDESYKPKKKRMGTLTFDSIEGAEGAAGSVYETEVYRIFNGGRCYQVGLMVHTSNVLAHQRGVRVVNTRTIFANLQTILRTMYFGH